MNVNLTNIIVIQMESVSTPNIHLDVFVNLVLPVMASHAFVRVITLAFMDIVQNFPIIVAFVISVGLETIVVSIVVAMVIQAVPLELESVTIVNTIPEANIVNYVQLVPMVWQIVQLDVPNVIAMDTETKS